MPSSAVKGVIAAVSIAFGSCAGLFAAGSSTDDCERARAHEDECSAAGPATVFGLGACSALEACLAECSLAASCSELSDFSFGLPTDVSTCVENCQFGDF